MPRKRPTPASLQGARNPYASLRPQTNAEFFIDLLGPRLFQLLQFPNRDEAARGFLRLWDALRKSPASVELLRLPPRRKAGREPGSFTIDKGEALAIAIAIDWGNMTAVEVLEYLGRAKPNEKVEKKAHSWHARRLERGRAILALRAGRTPDFSLDRIFGTEYPRRAYCKAILEAFRQSA